MFRAALSHDTLQKNPEHISAIDIYRNGIILLMWHLAQKYAMKLLGGHLGNLHHGSVTLAHTL